VTAAHAYEDLHRLVDRLTPDQADEVRAHVLRLVRSDDCSAPAESEENRPIRDLSFIGIMSSGETDLSIRHEEILREEFNRRP
jgi:hypothetical protein